MSSRILQAVNHIADNDPERVALTSGDWSVSYGDLVREVDMLSDRLASYKNRCLALAMENSPEWVIADLACIKAGVISLPLPPFFTDIQRDYISKKAGVAGIIQKGFAIYPLDHSPVTFPEGTDKITFTSGTTGHPKGVCLSQSGMEQVAVSLLETIGHLPAKKTAALLPLAVLLENIAGCYTTLLAGGCYDVCPQEEIGLAPKTFPDFALLIKYLAKSGITSCILVPELLRGVIAAMSCAGLSLPTMQFMAVGGSKVSTELLSQAEKLGLPVYQGYGLSECASVVAVNIPSDYHIKSVGKPLAHIELRIADDGEIIIRDPAFLGYLGEAYHTECYGTGDLGHLDDEGYLYITGRKKNVLINAYGRNICPEWPESELLAQPEIAQCLVFGDAAPSLSALIVPAKTEMTPVTLKAAVASANMRLPDYAQVKHWNIVKPFTASEGLLTGTGRPKREAILETYRSYVETLSGEKHYANIF